MRFRKLRIAWLIVCVAIGLLLNVVRESTYPDFENLVLPCAVMLTALAAVPWLQGRFTLRTLLIATTLVAVMLGLVVAVLRWPAD
jgi:hypothetical protein